MSKDGRIWLSHTGLETLERCPRCFWLQYKMGIRQPEGIVSRLANRFDVILKDYFDIYRSSGEIPPLVKGELKGKLQNPFKDTYFIQINERYGFYGKLDECLINEEGNLVPIDFKTASSDPRGKEIFPAYQAQIDDYLFVLQQNRKKTANHGYLVYVYPDQSNELHVGFPMVIHVQKLSGDPSRSQDRIKKAIEILDGNMPEPKDECSFCLYRKAVNTFEIQVTTNLVKTPVVIAK